MSMVASVRDIPKSLWMHDRMAYYEKLIAMTEVDECEPSVNDHIHMLEKMKPPLNICIHHV